MTKTIFFLGKGGVGKSTTAVLTSIYLSKKGKNVLLVSLDPAHNLSDILNKKLSDKSTSVKQNLKAIETDNEYWIKKYLNEIENKIQKSYNYLTALNLHDHFNLIKYSPGIEEYGLIKAYESIMKEYSHNDYLLFDMPPSALTLKFFNLPSLTLLWLEKLLLMRKEINNKKEIISKIKFGKSHLETDKILINLENQVEYYQKIKTIFENSEVTKLNLVLNIDKLSISESKLIINKLSEINLKIDYCTVNRLKVDETFDDFEIKSKINLIQQIPVSETSLIGLNELEVFLDRIKMLDF